LNVWHFLSAFIFLFFHDLHFAVSVGSLVLGNTVILTSTTCSLWIKTSHLIPETTFLFQYLTLIMRKTYQFRNFPPLKLCAI